MAKEQQLWGRSKKHGEAELGVKGEEGQWPQRGLEAVRREQL